MTVPPPPGPPDPNWPSGPPGSPPPAAPSDSPFEVGEFSSGFGAPPPPGPPAPPRPSGSSTPKIIAIVVAALVVIGGGIGAAIALTGGGGHKHVVVGPGPSSTTATTTHHNSGSSSGNSRSGNSGNSGNSGKSTSTSAPANGALSLGNGISITPASGWTTQRQSANAINLTSPDKSEFMFITVGAAQGGNVTAALQSDINNDANNPNYSNVQLQGQIQTTNNVTGNFNSAAEVGFTATGSQNFNGGAPVTGIYVEALNSTTGNSVFAIAYAGSSDELSKNQSDFFNMLDTLG